MNSESAPFSDGTKIHQIFTVLQDQKWHCGKHEFPGTQPAKAIQIIRQTGYAIENSNMFCEVCKDRTVHRRLVSLEPVSSSFVRLQMPQELRRRVLATYGNTEAVTLREMLPNQLEVDHRFPQVRWSQDEQPDLNMPDKEIHRRFQLLTRQNNLWKSRYCEKCKATGERGTFVGINYWAEGGSRWDPEISEDDERGCYGCFWYDPAKWRFSLNAVLNRLRDHSR